jgi:hypothetical protein
MTQVHGTHRLAQDGVLGAVDTTGERGEGQSCVETEVQERVTAFPADPDGAVANGDFTLGTSSSGKTSALIHATSLSTMGMAGPL